MTFVDGAPVHFFCRRLGGIATTVVFGQVFVQSEACRSHRFLHVGDMCCVHFARTRADAEEVDGGDAIEGYFLVAFHRQSVVFVFEEDDALFSSLACHGGMGLQVGLVGEFVIAEMWCLDNVFQDVAHIAVDFLHADFTLVDGCHKAFHFNRATRLHQVVASLGGFHRAFFHAPVGHHDAVEAPFVAEHGGEHAMVLLRVVTVDFVVRRHHCPRLAFLDGDLEVLEVELAQGTVADAGVVFPAVDFLAVGGIVFYRGAHAVGLYATHKGGGHLARQQRVFGEILEVAATQWVTVQIDARGENDVGAIFQHFVTHGRGHIFHQRNVPRTGRQGAGRESRAIESLVGAFTPRLDVEAGRAVAEYRHGDAETLYRTGVTRRAGHHGFLAAHQ